jgi:hypothetical protein
MRNKVKSTNEIRSKREKDVNKTKMEKWKKSNDQCMEEYEVKIMERR